MPSYEYGFSIIGPFDEKGPVVVSVSICESDFIQNMRCVNGSLSEYERLVSYMNSKLPLSSMDHSIIYDLYNRLISAQGRLKNIELYEDTTHYRKYYVVENVCAGQRIGYCCNAVTMVLYPDTLTSVSIETSNFDSVIDECITSCINALAVDATDLLTTPGRHVFNGKITNALKSDDLLRVIIPPYRSWTHPNYDIDLGGSEEVTQCPSSWFIPFVLSMQAYEEWVDQLLVDLMDEDTLRGWYYNDQIDISSSIGWKKPDKWMRLVRNSGYMLFKN